MVFISYSKLLPKFPGGKVLGMVSHTIYAVTYVSAVTRQRKIDTNA